MAEKPKKPRKSFPLTPHVRGGWGKTYKGHQLYIAEPNPKKALERFNVIAGLIDRGEYVARRHQRRASSVTVGDVCNRYVYERQLDMEAGRLSKGAWEDYDDAAVEMVAVFGKDKLVEDLRPDDFTRLHRRLAKRLEAHAMGRMIQNCRSIWKHADENDWIPKRPKYGSVFTKPVTGRKEGQPFTVEEARVLVACAAASNVQLEAMLLLMLNGGYSAMDCAKLPRTAVDFGKHLVSFPRPKMKRRRAIDRVMVMWPETFEALAEVMAQREGDELVFRTVHGRPWVQGSTDSVRLLFQRIVNDLGWEVRGPSWFRHLHRTIADELEKPNAAARLMGHHIKGIAEVYIDRVENHRIKQLTDHIRSRLWPLAPPQHEPSGDRP